MEIFEFVIDDQWENYRLDLFLSTQFEEISRSYFQNLIEDERVKVNGVCKKSNYKLKLNDKITVDIPEPKELEVRPQDIALDIVYEDKDLVVINKPQGMVVHPAPGNYEDTLVNALLYHCKDLSGINGIIRPGIVHRIDKDTSGILVVAKNDGAHNKLAEQLKDHSMKRSYLAIVEGILKDNEGKIDKPLGRNPNNRLKMAVLNHGGKEAITHFTVIETFKSNTLIQCNLETGRTHQIRVHMAYLGHPLIGDPMYGFKKQRFKLKGQVLHAQELGFIHPSTGKYMEFHTDPPEYFKDLIVKLRNEI